jgi:hypothetical protein
VARGCGCGYGSNTGDACNAVVPGSCVIPFLSQSMPPTPRAGTIVAGTYDLTTLTFVGNNLAADQCGAIAETLVVSAVTADSFTLDTVVLEQGPGTARSEGTVIVAGETMTYTPICPPPSGGGPSGFSASYTATETSLTLSQPMFGDTILKHYQKR